MSLPTYLSGNVQIKGYRILREVTYGVLDKYDLTPSSWAMLGIVLEAKDGIRQSEISTDLVVKPPLITMMYKVLNNRGFLESVPNPFDTRSKLLSVTTNGKRFIKTVEKELNSAINELLNGLTEKDMLVYQKVLETIIANKQRMSN